MVKYALAEASPEMDLKILNVDVKYNLALAQRLNLHGTKHHMQVYIFKGLGPRCAGLRQKVLMNMVVRRGACPVQAVLINPARCLEPKPSEVGINVLDTNAEYNVRGERALADDRVVDMCSRAAEVVKVWERVQDVETGALEQLEVVSLEVVRQRRQLPLPSVVMVLVMVVQAGEVRVLLDKLGS